MLGHLMAAGIFQFQEDIIFGRGKAGNGTSDLNWFAPGEDQEGRIASAADEALAIERALFDQLTTQTQARAAEIETAARALAAADVLAMQARYHARYWGVGAVPGQPWLRPGGAIADTGMVGQYFAMWDRSSPLPRFETLSAAQRDRLRMQAALDALMVDLRTRPIALLHGDSQGANLFFEADGRPGYLDWQHCMLGHWGFDLAGFLITAVTVEDRRAHERDLLAGYLEALRRAGVDAPAFDAAFADYSRYAMWTFMWLMCPVEAHPEDVCYANSERAAAAIDDLGTLQLLGI